MMLPTLISVSVTPVSYFFCAKAGAAAKTRRAKESAIFPARCGRAKRVRTNGLAQRFMGFSPWARLDVYLAVSSGVFRLFAQTIAGGRHCRKQGRASMCRRFVAYPLAGFPHCGYCNDWEEPCGNI